MEENIRILVVDDDQQLLDLLELVLCANIDTLSKTQVLLCPDSTQAVELAKKYQPEIILLDILMPKKNGREVLLDLRADESTKSIPVVMVSVVAGADAIEEFRQFDIAEYITKPFRNEELVRAVQKIISTVETL